MLSELLLLLQKKGFHVNIVGIGLPKGGPIPLQEPTITLKDKDGNVVITMFNEQMCPGNSRCRKGHVC